MRRLIAILTLTQPGLAPAVTADDEISAAVDSGLKIVQKAAFNYAEKRSCFSCHHQTLPMLAMTEARRFGAEIDTALLQEQATYTHDFYKDRTGKVAAGEGVGGRSMTVAYSLWTLDIAGRKPDAVTRALTSYLLTRQEKDGRWKTQSHRPPLEASHPMATFLAAYYMEQFSESENEEAIAAANHRATDWLKSSPEKSQEDLNAKLWAALELEGLAESADPLKEKILANQKPDGGWSQLPGMGSDAYATGQSLFVLEKSGLPHDHPAIRRGVTFLLESQYPDGSWFVQTRSKPIQKYFDNGDPHGKSQFISIPATSWAIAALSRWGKK